eukprot:6057543-Pleurochrysis_carterae.AAC.1
MNYSGGYDLIDSRVPFRIKQTSIWPTRDYCVLANQAEWGMAKRALVGACRHTFIRRNAYDNMEYVSADASMSRTRPKGKASCNASQHHVSYFLRDMSRNIAITSSY